MNAKTTINEALFLERYEKLNERQKEAVDTIYGAVMVIAGPGTGKTEVLSMRIAQLLRSDAQVQPQEILCLTYTDEASNSMRKRLSGVIGAAAHKVNIHTFHGFCNTVIQNNSEYFSKREMQPIDDLERADLLHKLLDELPPGHLMRRLSGDLYYDTGRLTNLFELMKKEHLTPEYISNAIDAYIESLPDREDFRYKRATGNFKKGDLKQKQYDEVVGKVQLTKAAALLFTKYSDMMRAAGRYDFADMILWVLDAFEKHQWLLQSYQERYQFILVDEFQDTNGAQNEILKQLSAYWDNPNVFVVGDDDQSIYEFQGARIRNIIEFYERHRNDIKIVVLPENYRSSQEVIDKAMATIGNNLQRLINQLNDLQLNKNIVAANERFLKDPDPVKPVVREYSNVLQEEADVVAQIEQLALKGVALKEVAVLYSQHKQADNIMALLERKGIPFNVKRKENVLQQPLTQQILNILRYLHAERQKKFAGEEFLFELMHAPWFGLDPNDIAVLALHMQGKKENGPVRWRLLLSNPLLIESLGLKSAKAMHRLGRNLDEWEKYQHGLPLPLFIEKVVYESGIVAHTLQTADHIWALQALTTFFNFVKGHWVRNERISVGGLLDITDRMTREKLKLELERTVQSDNGVSFYTAHSSKGNEFEHVFLIGCTSGFWEKKGGGPANFTMPDTITNTEEDIDKTYKTEVARRLFYVALTRAKKHLHISYALAENSGKVLEPTVFIEEISTAEEREKCKVPQEVLAKHMEWALQPVPEVRIRIANAEWIERMLQQFSMSATQLSKFLRCPLEFYYETILKVPMQKRDALAFGTAVHYALERMFKEMQRANGVFPTKEEVQAAFVSELKREGGGMSPVVYERRMEQGLKDLADYYDRYINSLYKDAEIELKIQRYYLDGVPVTGKIDKIELHPEGNIIVDYKTGDSSDTKTVKNLKPPSEDNPHGGDYWRQMVFYKLLLENYEDRSRIVKEGVFDYVQRNKNGEFKHFAVPMYKQDEDIVRQQLKDAYTRIMNHEFDRGCGEEKCHWCNFAKRYELIVRPDEPEMDDE
jgi:DNA helicase-2/ATP-dependent DNA helicase PcrA